MDIPKPVRKEGKMGKLTAKDFAASAKDKIAYDMGNGIGKLAFVSGSGIKTDSTLTMVAKNIDYRGLNQKTTYKMGNSQYFVGMDADGHDIIANKGFDYHVTYGKIPLYRMLSNNNLLGTTETKTLLVGVSFHDYTPSNILAIIKSLKEFEIDGVTVKFKHVLVTVQSIGSLKHYVGVNKIDMPKKAFILDVGTHTAITLGYVNGEVVPTNDIHTESGMIWILNKWYEYITNKYPDCKTSIQELNLLWRESLKLRDKDIAAGIDFFDENVLFKSKESKFMYNLFFFEKYRPDVSAFLYKLEKEYVFEFLVKTVLAANKSEIGQAQLVLIVGGTVHLLKYYSFDKIKDNFSFASQPYEFSNVMGLLYHSFDEISSPNVIGIYKTQLANGDLESITIKN